MIAHEPHKWYTQSMERVTGYTNLYRRGAIYYFRARVPLDVVDSYGKTEEKFSLKTKD